MNQKLSSLMSRMRTRQGASVGKIDEVSKRLKVRFPEDYQEFLWTTDGASGFASKNLYAIFWRVEELVALNEAYHVNLRVPGLCLFGSTGSGEAFAFDTTKLDLPVALVPFVPMRSEFARIKTKK